MKTLRIGLCGSVAFAVLAHGAVEVWSEAILNIGVALLFALWAVLVARDPQRRIYGSPLMWPLLGLLAIGAGQLLFRATAYAFLTEVETLRILVYLLFFFLAAQAFRERSDLETLAWFLMAFGFAVSLFGIAQRYTSPDTEIYWFRKLTAGGDPFGPYVNRNHFAGFVELVAPVGLAVMVLQGVRRDLFALAALFTVVPIGALLLSGSRGGIVSLGFEIAVLVLLVRGRRDTRATRFAGLVIVTLAALALIVWLGAGKALERFSSLRPGDVSQGRRTTMALGAARIFMAHPVAGAGLGNLVTVFPRYDTAYDGKVVDHAHNDYLEGLAEAGLLGGLCGAAFLWILWREAQRNYSAEQGHFSRAIHAFAITAVCGLLLHSLVDFNLRIPSNALLFLLQASLVSAPLLPSQGPALRRRGRREEPVETTTPAD